MTISIEEWIDETYGKSVNVTPDWAPALAGECVSLVQNYIINVYDCPAVARGNAKDFGDNIIARGEGYEVTSPRYGDIIVYNGNLPGSGGFGHVAVYIDSATMYDQNHGGERFAAYRNMITGYIKQYIRMYGDEPGPGPDPEPPGPFSVSYLLASYVIRKRLEEKALYKRQDILKRKNLQKRKKKYII